MKLRLPVLLALWAVSTCFSATLAAPPSVWIEGGAIVTQKIDVSSKLFSIYGSGSSLSNKTDGASYIEEGTLDHDAQGLATTLKGGTSDETALFGLFHNSYAKPIWIKFDGGEYKSFFCTSIKQGTSTKITLTGDMNTWLANGNIERFSIANSANITIKGDLNIKVSGGTLKVLTGGWAAAHTGDINLILEGTGVIGATSFGYDSTNNLTQTGNIIIRVNGGTIGEKYDAYLTGDNESSPVVLGFAKNLIVTGNTELHVTNGLIKSDYITMGGVYRKG